MSADEILRAQRHGKTRVLCKRFLSVARDYYNAVDLTTPHARSFSIRGMPSLHRWSMAADTLDKQGEVILGGDVRYVANHLPTVLTDKERLAVDYVHHMKRSEVPHQIKTATRQRDDLTR